MVIICFPDGKWVYSWEADYYKDSRLTGPHKRIDIDRWHEYDMTAIEINACMEAINEAENRRSRQLRPRP